jgi:F-type H+-transporting ATPase subunit gamma
MATARELKRRIKSAKNIGQVTKALEMVSAVKMRRAQQQASAGRPYTENLLSALRTLSREKDSGHPYLRQPVSVSRILLVVIAPHKGLAGSLITNLARQVLLFSSRVRSGQLVLEDQDLSAALSDHPEVQVVTWGKKARSIGIKTGFPLVADFYADLHIPLPDHLRALSSFVTDTFNTRQADLVVLAYNQFVNTMTQEPRLVRFLPLVSLPGTTQLSSPLYTFEPSRPELLSALMDHYVRQFLNQIILDSFAAEHSARMVAMKNANENARDIVREFTLMYNKTRQSSITNEIADIVSGSFISV